MDLTCVFNGNLQIAIWKLAEVAILKSNEEPFKVT